MGDHQSVCPEIERMECFVRGELTEGECAAIGAHLEQCATCSRLCGDIRTNEALLSRLDTAISGGGIMSPKPVAAMPVIDGYEIEREIHRGGQGVVYAGVQVSTRRPVAVKLLLHGHYASPRERYRFEREIEILAALDHPSIVTVFDSGVTADGRLYLVMRFVAGRPLDQHVRAVNPSPDALLRLFEAICDAVRAAHLRGVMHRDLKPNNILVSDDGSPHLLDFGLAKLVESDGHDAGARHTKTGEFFGTLAYAAPEQVQADSNGMDVRSDVFSLGILLYEMLAGKHPYPLGVHPAELLDHIRKGEVARPSSVRRDLDDELDTIILKAMNRDPERRYQSAGSLLRDLAHYRRGEPIEAKADSMMYMMRKQLSRHRGVAIGAAAFLIGLLLFAAYAGVMAEVNGRLATQEGIAKQHAIESARIAGEARRLETEQRMAADRSAIRARAVTAFLADTFGMASPDVTQTAEMSALDLLISRSQDVDKAFADDPEAESLVRAGLAQAFYAHGRLELAQEHFARALELRETVVPSTPREIYDVMHPLVEILGDLNLLEHIMQRGRVQFLGIQILLAHDPELKPLREAWVATTVKGWDDADSAATYNALIERARQSIPPDNDLWLLLADQIQFRAVRAREIGLVGGACHYLRKALEIERRFLPETNTRVVRTVGLLIRSTIDLGDYAEAERLAAESLTILRRVLPESHWYVAANRAWQAEAIAGLGRLAEGRPLLERAIPDIVAGRGRGSPYVNEALEAMVHLDAMAGDAEALEKHRIMLARSLAASIRESTLDQTLLALGPEQQALTEAIHEVQRFIRQPAPEMGAAIDRVIETRRSLLADSDPRAALFADLLAIWGDRYSNTNVAYDSQLKESHLERMNAEALRIARASPDRHLRKLAALLRWLSAVHWANGRFVEGEAAAREAIAILDAGIGESWGLRSVTCMMLGICLEGQRRFEEAEPALIESYNGLCKSMGPMNGNTANAIRHLTGFYISVGRPNECARWCAAHIDRVLPDPDVDWGQLNAYAWWIVKYAGFEPAFYDAAVRGARRAVELNGDRAGNHNTLGAALYRVGLHDEALDALRRAEALRESPSYADVAFLALTYAASGEPESAHRELARLMALGEERSLQGNAEYILFLEEASGQIEGEPAETAGGQSDG